MGCAPSLAGNSTSQISASGPHQAGSRGPLPASEATRAENFERAVLIRAELVQAKRELAEGRSATALQRAKAIIASDPNFVEAYELGLEASVVLERPGVIDELAPNYKNLGGEGSTLASLCEALRGRLNPSESAAFVEPALSRVGGEGFRPFLPPPTIASGVSVGWLINYGCDLCFTTEYGRAASVFRTALGIDGQNAIARQLLSDSLWNLGKKAQSIVESERAVQLYTGVPRESAQASLDERRRRFGD